MNFAVGGQRRGEGKSHAKFPELDGDYGHAASACLYDRKRELAASQKTRFFSRLRQDVRFRKDLDQVRLLQGGDCSARADIRPKQEDVENV